LKFVRPFSEYFTIFPWNFGDFICLIWNMEKWILAICFGPRFWTFLTDFKQIKNDSSNRKLVFLGQTMRNLNMPFERKLKMAIFWECLPKFRRFLVSSTTFQWKNSKKLKFGYMVAKKTLSQNLLFQIWVRQLKFNSSHSSFPPKT
jgi:hypothetical protein